MSIQQKHNPYRRLIAVFSTMLLICSGNAQAQNTFYTGAKPVCSKAGLSTLIDFDFNSGFPLRIMGFTLVSGGDVPPPRGATDKAICSCGKPPFYVFGITQGMWLPTRVVEVVRDATCSPVYGDIVKPVLSAMATLAGIAQSEKVTRAGGEGHGYYDTSFRHFHSWRFPFNPYIWSPVCFYKGGILETSVALPMWSKKDKVYMNLLYPEWAAIGAVVSNPLIDLSTHTASCVVNTTGAGSGKIDDAAYWLGGCMGNSLPATGSMSSVKNSIIGTSTILNRSIMVSNRTLGYASVSTVGNKSLCIPVPVPYPSKSEFKASMLFPYPESGSANRNSTGSSLSIDEVFRQLSGEVADFLKIGSSGAHRLGASGFAWAIGRSDQAVNSNDSDAVYLLWRWVDCCQLG